MQCKPLLGVVTVGLLVPWFAAAVSQPQHLGEGALPSEPDEELARLRRSRNAAAGAAAREELLRLTEAIENRLSEMYGNASSGTEGSSRSSAEAATRREWPGNFHGLKSHGFYTTAIAKAQPAMGLAEIEGVVASEWYHPGLLARPVWCNGDCAARADLPLAKRLQKNFEQIRREASPEVWTNPWSHVLLSVLLEESWVPFHRGHNNGQLTYHLPIALPAEAEGVAELAVLQRGGSLPEAPAGSAVYSHPEEVIHHWHEGKTLVFDDSFSHAVRYRGRGSPDRGAATGSPRVVLLTRAWHPGLDADERRGLRSLVSRSGEEEPPGYDLLPLSRAVFEL